MHPRIAVPLLALAAAFSCAVQATPLDQIREAPVSKLEFGSFKLEVALTGIRDWPFPIEGVGVSYKLDPDQVEIVVAVRKVRAESIAQDPSLWPGPYCHKKPATGRFKGFEQETPAAGDVIRIGWYGVVWRSGSATFESIQIAD